ncbi:TPA: hypothetical protein RRX17_005015 [Klebsiella pneumoniae]|nr:hypothetical protein [Klebsiella pneumoniae]HDY6990737.1 hypothetical protein [Klebsiella pneumoniae]HDY7047790.1 hypothetical protein [Klebsiella pneumoniae]HDY7379027.1 hypothetical protein [Klebsiella pneumoniae]HDY7384191.1 hypothetical protein [Klebsiella pneumoniae]
MRDLILQLSKSSIYSTKPRDGYSYVFRIDGDKVRQQKVILGARRGDRIEIREGLSGDTPVVESGASFLADGVTVNVNAASGNMSSTDR